MNTKYLAMKFPSIPKVVVAPFVQRYEVILPIKILQICTRMDAEEELK